MQHAYWLLEKRKTVRVSTPTLFRGPARKDSAVRVSLSSYYNVKEPVAERPKPHSRTPNGSKTALGSQRQPVSAGKKNPGIPRFCPMDRAVAYSPAGSWETTRAKPVFRDWIGPCQGAHNGLWVGFRFRLIRGYEATFLPEYVVTLASLTAW